METKVIICRFNGFWKKPQALHQWIFSSWKTNLGLDLFSKGLFIVHFDTHKEYDFVSNEGPWFWGNTGLFTTPWILEFDATNMVVSKISIWVRLPNIHFSFWHEKVLWDIGNTIGKFKRRDAERFEKGIFAFSRIFMVIDLSEGLPNHFILKCKYIQWFQILNYQNTTFICRHCLQVGHIVCK